MKGKPSSGTHKIQSERFKIMVRQMLQLPERGNDQELIEALKARGASTLEWYEERVQAIEDYNRNLRRPSLSGK